MSDTERMTIDERYKYLRGMQKRYGKGGRAERSRLLDEMERLPWLHPYAALTLALQPMLVKSEIDSEEYLRLTAHLLSVQRKPYFTAN